MFNSIREHFEYLWEYAPDSLVIPDSLERQSFTTPFRAFEWAEAPELERAILAYFSIVSQPQSNHPPWNFPY